MKRGIYYDMNFIDYLEEDSISNSSMNIFNECPRKFYGDSGLKETRNMLFGSAVHCAFLEPENFENNYVASSVSDRRLKAWREESAACAEAGKILLTADEYKKCLDIQLRVFNQDGEECKAASEIVRSQYSKNEVSIFWQDEETGLNCKGRIDLWNEEYRCIVDLKTTSCAEPNEFMCKSVPNYNYHVQMAFYLDGLNKCIGENYTDALFLCVEKDAPYEFSIICLDEIELELGRRQYKETLSKIKQCFDNDFWPTYGSGNAITRGRLPSWAFKKHDDLLGLAIERQELENANKID